MSHRLLRRQWTILAVAVGVVAAMFASAQAQPPQPPLVAETDPLSPTEQQKKFRLPPGFEIQLVLAEPAIGQPMNLNFDAAGRLWVTHSIEYPFPARGDVEPRDDRFAGDGDHEPRDRLTVAEGIGPDGKPARTWNFADGLNIPIGHVPVKGGAIVYGIPYIFFCPDADADGRADSRQILYGKFGNVDTHGMNNGFTRWIDGWIYACHGFRNTSNVKGGDGHAFMMNSGNTYRFREDGSRIEQFTWGQVNPFGLTFDPLGNAYTADCHSMPLTALLRGAYYSSFGKPHDGLGFGPDMIDHNHGSTGICGPAYYAAAHFPPEYRDNLFLCNPVTGRVHRDRLKDVGSTRLVETQPDFITCDDPWFRPVDVQVGPDGALYVADFYNSIIGHYEVPLKHPRRDRERGRVWRVVYRGTENDHAPPAATDLTRLSLEQLVARLGDANLVVRMLATNEIIDRFGTDALPQVEKLFTGASTPEQRAHGLWILFRLNRLDLAAIEKLSGDDSRLVRTHLAKSLAERARWQPAHFDVARRLLNDEDAFVRRAAADALGRKPRAENIEPLLSLLRGTSNDDSHLQHTIRIALRNQLADDTVVAALNGLKLDEIEPDSVSPGKPTPRSQLASVCLAVPTAAAADWLAEHLRHTSEPQPDFLRYIEHVARHGSAGPLESLATVVRKRFADDVDFQIRQLESIRAGLEQRGVQSSGPIRNWAAELALGLFTADTGDALSWTNSPLPDAQRRDDAWAIEQRRCADGREGAFFSTLPRGENATGVLRSEPFALPPALSFYVAGHCGFPDRPCHGKNVVRLRAAGTGAVLAETPPPRNDTAQRFEWSLPQHAGTKVYVELVDGDGDARGYAWLAVGRFSFEPLNPQRLSRLGAAARLVERFRLDELQPMLIKLLSDERAKTAQRVAAADGLLGLRNDSRLSAMLPLAGSPTITDSLRNAIFAGVVGRDEKQIRETLAMAMDAATGPQQAAIAETLAGDPAGGEALLSLVADGKASARLLTRPALRQKLDALKLPGAAERIARLTSRLPSADETALALIAERRRAFSASGASAERGFEVFKQNCASCHRIGEEGAVIAPQLDGVGLRALDRLLEDLLDPNRNVDAAFRSTTIVLTSGKVRTGLFRREQGETLVFADDKGQEFSIAKADVDDQAISPLSPMPGNFGEKINVEDFNHLLAYLLKQRAAPPEK